MKVKDTVYEYSIKLDFYKDTVEQKQAEYKVIGVNNERLCIGDRTFTTIKRKKQYRGDNDELFGEVSVFDSQYKNYWDYIRATLYSASPSKKIAYKRMKKALEKFINTKHGRYCNAMIILNRIEV